MLSWNFNRRSFNSWKEYMYIQMTVCEWFILSCDPVVRTYPKLMTDFLHDVFQVILNVCNTKIYLMAIFTYFTHIGYLVLCYKVNSIVTTFKIILTFPYDTVKTFFWPIHVYPRRVLGRHQIGQHYSGCFYTLLFPFLAVSNLSREPRRVWESYRHIFVPVFRRWYFPCFLFFYSGASVTYNTGQK